MATRTTIEARFLDSARDKVFLDEWYSRIGYRVIRTDTLDGTYPELAPLLATECEFVIYERPL